MKCTNVMKKKMLYKLMPICVLVTPLATAAQATDNMKHPLGLCCTMSRNAGSEAKAR